MTNYHLFSKQITPTLKISRYTKILFFTLIGIIIGYFIFIGKSRNKKLLEIYKFQATIADILDLEIHYMAKQMFTEEDMWIKMNNIEGHIYSAYLDTRPEIIYKYSHTNNKLTWGEIFIIALLPTKIEKNSLTCVLKYETNDRKIRLNRVPAQLKILNDNWNLKYSAFFIICDLTQSYHVNQEFVYNYKQLPESVGIEFENMKNNSTKFVDIHYPTFSLTENYEKSENFMSICVPVLHHNYDRALELIEFIEYYKIMGINHFTLYNSSISREVNQVLEFYKTEFTASVLSWTLPSTYVYEQTLRQEGLFAALNDCLYRNTHHKKFKYIGTFDVDEFLVPSYYNNFTELMKQLDQNNEVASFLFRNVYFYTMYQDDEEIENNVPYLYTAAKTRRLKNPHPPRERSRYIVRGLNSFEIGNYNVWEFREGSLLALKKGFKEFVVDPKIALLHHYAPCEAEETGCYLKSIEIDKTAQRFSKQLSERVLKVCSNIFGENKCPSPKKRESGSKMEF